MSIKNDLLKTPKGKWSRKSVLLFASFLTAVLYEFTLPFFGVVTKEYVFIGLLVFAATLAGMTVYDKKKQNVNIQE